MKSLYTLLMSFMIAFSASVWADSPSKAELYEGIEVTVNINTATAEELSALLVGIGDKKAEEIVQYRDQHGAFQKPDDLANVKGIGVATVEKNRKRIEL
ncbi:helix-hairpin-helix domain-containing protein [Vibrio pelagius]|uniref:Helix-hairpin-helix domain-containing protein n=1 Tax=Vibrio pelagius TaxID=28169 RepID=A0ABY5G4X1_VIBPE|nr:helix-hairpin-helix domain-containing protein [Vibrio pelagius]UTT85203.1 helix-hairpin-helix domain-containing protein [Vibrio pelagius]